MSFSVNTNNGAMAAIQLLGQTNKSLDMTQERINSGFKVNGARDNASTFTIAEGMRGDVAGFSAVSDQLSMAESVTGVAVNAGEQILGKLEELNTEVLKATDPTANRQFIQETINSITQDIDSIADAAQFNGVNLVNGSDTAQSFTSSLNRTDPNNVTTSQITVNATNISATNAGGLALGGIDVQNSVTTLEFGAGFAGAVADNETINFDIDNDGDGTADQTISFEFIDDATTTASTSADHIAVNFDAGDSQGVIVERLQNAMRDEGFTVNYDTQGRLAITHQDGDVVGSSGATAAIGAELTFDATATEPDFDTLLANVQTARDTVSQALSQLGTTANRIESQREFVNNLADSLTSGVGSLVDANMAEESARLQSLQTKQQLGVQALGIANQAPQTVLSLFQ